MLIRQQLVTGDARLILPGVNPVEWITIHETGNTSAGADAAAHATLQSRGNSRTASWHYTVDDHEAVQSYDDRARCMHAGDGATGTGNTRSIGIEICVNADGDYAQAVRNAAALVKILMARHGIPADRVVQHNHWSGKNCPSRMRSTPGAWEAFQTTIQGAPAPAPAPVPQPPSPKLAVDGWWGSATTRALQTVFGTPVDGIVSSQSAYRKLRVKAATSGWEWTTRPRGSRLIAAMQAWLGVDADGIVGPDTINALTARMGLVPDGVLDGPSNTVRVMQRRLNAGTFRS
jgi:hypothetical protein